MPPARLMRLSSWAMDWRQPEDELGQQLIQAMDSILADPTDARSLQALEPILLALYTNYDQARVDRLGEMGWELEEKLGAPGRTVSMEVAQFCAELGGLLGRPNDHTANVGQMLIWLREILTA